MAFVATNLINGVLLAVLFVVYFFFRSKFLHVGAGLSIVILLFQMQAPTFIILAVSLFLVFMSYSFLFQRSKAGVYMGLLLLLLPFSLAGGHTLGQVNNTGVPTPDGYEGAPDMILEIRGLESVKRITNQPELNVLGTDYLSFDNGKLMAYLTQGGFPIDNAACYVSVLYPNMSFFIDDIAMFAVNITNFEGLYYLDFNVPNQTGVYPVNAHCHYNVTPQKDEVSVIDTGFTIGVADSLSFERKDGVITLYEGAPSCSTIYCNATYTFIIPIGYETPYLNAFYVQSYFYASTGTTRIYNITVYNYLTNSWDSWYTFTQATVPQIEQFDLNDSYVNNNELKVRLEAFDFKNGVLAGDLLLVRREYNGTIVADLRGNSEIVVSKKLDNATNLIINPPPQEILSSESIFNILSLLAIGLTLVGGLHIVAGFIMVLWVIIYSTNIYITLGFLLFALYLFYRGATGQKT